MNKVRCNWCGEDPLYIDYHDKEWGVPIHQDGKLFEFLILEGMQAGLSWITILKKRDNYRQAFANFDANKIARFTDKKLEKLLTNPGIIRNRRKVYSIRQNAQAYLALQEGNQNFSDFIWQFTDGKIIRNKWKNAQDAPANTIISDVMAKTLKQHGFNFVGSTICYAYMQAVGIVNDHVASCFRYHEV